jgi:hypothetical protein
MTGYKTPTCPSEQSTTTSKAVMLRVFVIVHMTLAEIHPIRIAELMEYLSKDQEPWVTNP